MRWPKRRSVSRLALTLSISTASIALLLVYVFAFLPESRAQRADRLLAVYSTTCDPEIAQRLADMVDREQVPLEKREDILKAILRPVVRMPPHFVSGEQVVIRFARPTVRFGRHVVAEGLDYEIGPHVSFKGCCSNDPFAELSSFRKDVSFDQLPDGRQTLLPGHYVMLVSLTHTLHRKEPVPERGLHFPWTPRMGRYRLTELLSTSYKIRLDFTVVEPCDAGRGK